METLFIITAAVAVTATVLVITGSHVVHALLCLVLSLLAVAALFFFMGAPFAAALEVIVYAGAIMVTFVFVIMMLNLGSDALEHERRTLAPRFWLLPLLLGAVLLAEVLYVIHAGWTPAAGGGLSPQQVGASLFGPYLLVVELAAFLLAAGLLGACHLARGDG